MARGTGAIGSQQGYPVGKETIGLSLMWIGGLSYHYCGDDHSGREGPYSQINPVNQDILTGGAGVSGPELVCGDDACGPKAEPKAEKLR